MDSLPKNKLIEFHPDTLEAVRKVYGLDKPGAMKESIDIFATWIKTQNHFTKKDFNADYLERRIIASKGSVQKAKERIDKFFTLKNLMPIFFREYDPHHFDYIKDMNRYGVLPKLTNDHSRVFYHKLTGKNFTSSILLDGYRLGTMICEYLTAHDYAKSFIVVVDYLDVDMKDVIGKSDLMELRQAVVAWVEGYAVRIESIHVLINSKLVDVVISIAKQMVSEKIGKRIHCHKSYEDLFKHIPIREIFPKECGGEEKSLKEIQADWLKELNSEEFREYWKMMLTARTNESLRQGDTFNAQYIGMPGTFRTLSVD